MESGIVEKIPDTAADPTPVNTADVRRRAWAESREQSQKSKPERSDPPDSQQSQSDGDNQRHAEEPGQNPNKIVSWLFDCSTPTRGSIDDQSASLNRGVLRNGCSFEDDLSLGAEANHLQSTINNADPSFGLAADQKRSQYKERGRSMNSTGSGKSSTVSSVSELLDMYEEDPEEILLNLGFGREEPDLSSKIPCRFFNSTSAARGIDIKVYLGAQLQRLEVENPNYALTSRFRQMEVFTTVANEFFQLYSNVSGQQVRRIGIKEPGGGEGEGGGGGGGGGEDGEVKTSNLKKSNSVLNVAKILKKNMSKRNILSTTTESTEANSPNQQKDLNGPTSILDHPLTNGHAGPEQDKTNSGDQVEMVNQKLIQKRDHFSQPTITEETNADQLINSSPEQSSPGPEHQPESEDLQQTNQRMEGKGTQVVKEETNIASTTEKVASTVPLRKLAQLRTENADSFDMEEIQTNEDEALPCRTSRTTDLSRTVSQQSDSSGFAEEPSVYSNSYLKVLESSDSCDSETTVTSHPSQDIATPHALDQPAFDLPGGGATKADGRSRSSEDDMHEESSEQVPRYTVHYLPKSRPAEDGEQVDGSNRTDHEPEPLSSQSMSEQKPQPELEHTQSRSVSEQDPKPTEQLSEVTIDTPSEEALDKVHMESASSESGSSSPVLSALNRAKRNHPCRKGQHNSIQCDGLSKTPGVVGRRRGVIPMQRSSSLPSSNLSPARVVSSVKIQFKQGQASCTSPRYSLKYTQKAEEDKGEDVVLADEDEEKEQSNCLSTLIINPGVKEKLAPIPPKPIPSYLLSSYGSLHSASPPPEWSPVSHAHSWSTQSVPDLTSSYHQLGMSTNQNQQRWSSGQMFPSHSPSAVFSDSPRPSPNSNPSPYPSTSSPYLNNQHNPSFSHYFTQPYLHQPYTSPVPPHGSVTNLHHPSASTAPQHFSLGHQHPGTPPMHHQSYIHPYIHQLPYPANPHGSQYASPYHGTPGFTMNPHLQSGPPHSAPPGLGPEHCPSSTEMQLRRVLHDIRGTVQSLGQSRVNTPDSYSELRAAAASRESLVEFQQKRRSLNVFRSQMTDLEQSIRQQQTLFYNHLSPADRRELQQLQSLRLAVREELQELEQQLEDRLFDLAPYSHHTGLHRDTSVDNLSTVSALRAMEPVSDLLREQFFLQSELCYGDRGPLTNPSTRSPSPFRGDDGKQRQGVYRASINITPAARPRPNAYTEENEEEVKEGQIRSEGVEGVKKEEEEEASEKEGAAAKLEVDNLQQLIREIRENVAQEVRREIYQELLAAASPQSLPFSTRQHPL